jgi:class 3 adenylate cyclase
LSALKEKIILAVDDDQAITQPLERLIRRMLRKNKLDTQYRHIVTNSPAEALTQIKTMPEELSLVIADIMMPEMHGLKFLKEVKKLCPLAPRIVLTGYADKENAITALNDIKLFYYAEKPWENDWFEQLILNGLDQYRKAKLETIFRKYVPFEIIEEFVNRNDETILTGKMLEATVLFLDIVEFTKKTEEMDASELVSLLNQYFTAMVSIIHQHGGILDKFTGDGLMALFGIPTSVDIRIEAKHAILAALGMIDQVREINAQYDKSRLNPIQIRIGINTGPVVVGNVGSQDRVNYTAIGDTVNTASRIEDAARHFVGQSIGCTLISQNTYHYVKDTLQSEVSFAQQPNVPLRGKEKQLPLYTVTRKS